MCLTSPLPQTLESTLLPRTRSHSCSPTRAWPTAAPSPPGRPRALHISVSHRLTVRNSHRKSNRNSFNMKICSMPLGRKETPSKVRLSHKTGRVFGAPFWGRCDVTGPVQTAKRADWESVFRSSRNLLQVSRNSEVQAPSQGQLPEDGPFHNMTRRRGRTPSQPAAVWGTHLCGPAEPASPQADSQLRSISARRNQNCKANSCPSAPSERGKGEPHTCSSCAGSSASAGSAASCPPTAGAAAPGKQRPAGTPGRSSGRCF